VLRQKGELECFILKRMDRLRSSEDGRESVSYQTEMLKCPRRKPGNSRRLFFIACDLKKYHRKTGKNLVMRFICNKVTVLPGGG
jgi:hypothetical protein